MSKHKQDDMQLPESTAAQAGDEAQQEVALPEAEQNEPVTSPDPIAIPRDRMDGRSPDEADATPAAPAGDMEQLLDDPLGQLKANLDQHYRAVVSTEMEWLAIQKRRTGEYYDLGEVAIELKSQLEHGEWLPFLAERGYVERTIQRAMRIHKLFKGKRVECLDLTVEDAENFGKAAEEAEEEAARKASEAEKQALEKSRKELLEEAQKRAEERQGEEKELAATPAAMRILRLPEKTDESPLDVEPGKPGAAVSGPGGETGDVADGEEVTEGDDQEDPEVKSEILWGVISEVADGLEITDAEQEALAAFMIAVGDEARAVRLLLYQVWKLI